MVRAAAVALAVGLALAPPAGAAEPRRATITLHSLAPLTVRGQGFGSGESVLLTYAAAGERSRVVGVRATRAGTFRIAFPVRVGRCDSFTVRAVGVGGSRAVLQVERACKGVGGPRKRAPDPS